jgi:hypothetical protein
MFMMRFWFCSSYAGGMPKVSNIRRNGLILTDWLRFFGRRLVGLDSQRSISPNLVDLTSTPTFIVPNEYHRLTGSIRAEVCWVVAFIEPGKLGIEAIQIFQLPSTA